MTHKDRNIYEFGEFRLLPTENILERGGNVISLKPKAFAALVYLVGNHGRLVEKSDLLDHVWNGAFVEEASVSKCIWEIRAALEDKSKDGRYIQTVPKHGYRFVADVNIANGDERSIDAADLPTETPSALALSSEAAPIVLVSDPPRPDDDDVIQASPARPIVEVPTGRRSHLPVYLAAGLVAVAVATAFVYFFYRKPTSSAPTNIATLAILPLKPVVADNRDQALEFAIVDSLILKISEAKNLNVKRLFAVRKFTELTTDPVAAGRELEVNYVLSSTYQIFDGRIRVTSQLINVETGLADQTFRAETDTGNVFAVQDFVSGEISSGLFAKFGTPANFANPKRATENEKAYTLYNEALFLLDKNNRDDSVKAIDLLDQAVGMDPDYAAAWAAKAQAYCLFAHTGGGTPIEVFAKAEPNLEKALVIDNNNAVALTIRGMINRDYYWNTPAAYRDLDRAIELDPSSALAHRILAGAYYQDARFAEAVAEGKKAVDLNPTGRWDKWFLASYEAAAGSPDEGIAGLLHLADFEPKFQPTYYSLWRLYFLNSKPDKAFEYFIKNKQIWEAEPKEIADFQKTYAKSGWKGVLQAELDLMRSHDRLNVYSTRKVYIAELAAQVGDADVAFQYLDEALKFRSLQFSNVKVDPFFEPIRNDPRYAQLLTRAKL
ncbi:MAG TPA: winged helix-turn-helix domain-containing protein [Pyrinomonadaceae bacterium]|nr:winged helix-turn-helix domain-containing protein [Pyrinomonadaceae bacterium]